MARNRRVPESSSRSSPAFWEKMVDASSKRREKANKNFARFARWHAGDLSDIIDPETQVGGKTMALENMINLATVASMADLFFRWPRFVCRAPYNYGPEARFSPQLARIETQYLAHTLRTINYRKKKRRALQDALIGDMGIVKITMDPEIVVDQEALEDATKEARDELLAFIQHGTDMRADDDQIHSVHIQVKRDYLSMAERGEAKLPRAALRYLRKHIATHEAMRGSERPTETIRAARIQIRRINPLDYFYDPTADDRDDCSWRGCRYLVRKADVLANDDYDRDARLMIQTADNRWEPREFIPNVNSSGSYDIAEDMVMIYEIYDLVDQKRRLWADGCALMLSEEDRLDLAIIQPSGPFSETVFVEDAMEGQGIAPPTSFEGEQWASTHIAATNVKAVVQSLPRTLYNSNDINADDAARIWNAGPAEFIPLQPKGNPDKPLEKSFTQVPVPQISDQSLAILSLSTRGIERRSGLGAPKMGGGETASTATAAALVADASTGVSEDRGATLDESCEYDARMIVRLTRGFEPKANIVTVCGPEAIEFYPDKFSIAEAASDIVDIIPGSSRRRNTSVDQKQLLDGVQAFQKDPAMQGPAAVKMRISMYRLYFEDGGVIGLGWNELEQEIAMQQAIMQQQAMMMGGGPQGQQGAQEGESPVGAGPQNGPGMDTQANDIQQGVSNVGGGRVPTGASVGDRVREVRGEATSRVVNRG